MTLRKKVFGLGVTEYCTLLIMAILIAVLFFLAYGAKVELDAEKQKLMEVSELCLSKGGALLEDILGNPVCIPSTPLTTFSKPDA